MAELSPENRNIVGRFPLDDEVYHLREMLREADQALVAGDPNSAQQVQKAMARLLGSLMLSEAALHLDPASGDLSLESQIGDLRRRILKEDLSYEEYRELVHLVLYEASDLDIWTALFNLVVTTSHRTPPTTVAPTVAPSIDSTPMTYSSASQQGTEQTRRLLEDRIFREIQHCTYRQVEGFFAKYFEGKRWTEQSKKIYQAMEKRHVDGRWTDFPSVPAQDAVCQWLFDFQKEFLPHAPNVYHTTSSTGDLTGAEARRQLDLLVKRRSDETPLPHHWRDVCVVGELKQSRNGLKPTLLQLSTYIHDIFTAQPTRRFVHGFFLQGTAMELWVFDRSGAYSSGDFDIHREPERFIQAIVGYAMMSDDDLGLDTFVERDGEDRCITITNDVTGESMRLPLERKAMLVQRAIVCRGTSCHRSRDGAHVVKFSWTSDKRPEEAAHLRMARERGVRGVASLLGHHCITTVAEMRQGLTFPAPYTFRENALSASPSVSRPPSQGQSSPLRAAMKRSSLRGSSFQPKAPDHERRSSQVSRPQRRRSQLHQAQNAAEPHDTTRPTEPMPVDQITELVEKPTSLSRKRKSDDDGNSDDPDRPIKRSSQTSQTSKPSPELQLQRPLRDSQTTSLFASDRTTFENRRFCCLAISPAGRAIHEFRSVNEVLAALRDAIQAHRSLYLDGRILHRDISENNIIITDPATADGFTGMLIDLDLAKEVGSKRSGARHRTGTMEFMAIEVLLGYAHTYRHDLESFFYVLLWICARRGWQGTPPGTSMLTKWYTGSFEDIATTKNSHMSKGRTWFGRILAEFPPCFAVVKPLCEDLRDVLFPIREECLFIGTPKEPEPLYRAIIEAFDDSIKGLGGVIVAVGSDDAAEEEGKEEEIDDDNEQAGDPKG